MNYRINKRTIWWGKEVPWDASFSIMSLGKKFHQIRWRCAELVRNEFRIISNHDQLITITNWFLFFYSSTFILYWLANTYPSTMSNSEIRNCQSWKKTLNSIAQASKKRSSRISTQNDTFLFWEKKRRTWLKSYGGNKTTSEGYNTKIWFREMV